MAFPSCLQLAAASSSIPFDCKLTTRGSWSFCGGSYPGAPLLTLLVEASSGVGPADLACAVVLFSTYWPALPAASASSLLRMPGPIGSRLTCASSP